MKRVDWRARKFYTIDVVQQEPEDVASHFAALLSRENVQSGEAIRNAEEIYEGRLRDETVAKTLPEAWNKIVGEPDSLLVELIAETTEKLSGYKPETEQVLYMLQSHLERISLPLERTLKLPHIDRPEKVTPRPKTAERRIAKLSRGLSTSQPSYRPPILQALVELGGRGDAEVVLQRVYSVMMGRLNEYDRQTLESGEIRWHKNANWARYALVKAGLLSGSSSHGIWEITEAGRRWLAEARRG